MGMDAPTSDSRNEFDRPTGPSPMRRARFRDPAGSVRTGEWTADGITFGGVTYDPNAVDVLPPGEPTKVVCVGLNYQRYAAEVGRELPDRPRLFFKPPHTLAGHGDTVTLPAGKERVDREAELGVVVGEQCRNVPEARDGRRRGIHLSERPLEPGRPGGRTDLVRSKAFDSAAPMGPVVASPDEVPDDARIRLRVNGDTRPAFTPERPHLLRLRTDRRHHPLHDPRTR